MARFSRYQRKLERTKRIGFFRECNIPGLHLHEMTPPLDVQYSVPVATQSLHFNADGVVSTVGAAVVPNISHFVPLYP